MLHSRGVSELNFDDGADSQKYFLSHEAVSKYFPVGFGGFGVYFSKKHL